MEFRILGPLRVVGDAGSPVRLGPRTGRVLAALLLEAGQIVAWHDLVDAVWDDGPPTTARRQINNCVWMLRKDLPVVADGPGYRVPIRPGQLDAQVFEDAVARARSLAGAGQTEQAVEEFTAALRLWRGPALVGCDGRRIRAGAARLDEQRLAATEQRLGLELELGRHHEVVGELTGLVAVHPLREVMVGHLMRALHGSGRQADALSVYQRLRERLAEEMGLDPGSGLQELHTAILRNEIGLAGRGPPHVEPAVTAVRVAGGEPKAVPGAVAVREALPGPRVWALPRRLAYFAGRIEELALLREHHGRGGRPGMVIVWGLGGIGKTSLALEYAHRTESGRGLVAWIPATDRGAVIAGLAELGRELGITGANHEEVVRRTLAGLDRRAPWLLVYDDATPDALRGLLPPAGDGDVLITSRDNDWEDVGDTLEIRELPEDDAVTLMLARSHDQSPGAADHARHLVRRLGRLPLAVDLAGAYCRDTCSIADYRNQLERTGLRLVSSRRSPASGEGNTLAAGLSVQRVAGRDTTASHLHALLAWFAPGHLPQSTITGHAHLLPPRLRKAAADPVRWHEIVGQLHAAGLTRAEPGFLWSHQLIQEVQRDRTGDQARSWIRRLRRVLAEAAGRDATAAWTPTDWKSLVLRLITADFPADWDDTEVWAHCAALLPHATALLDDAWLPGVLLGDLADRVTAYNQSRGRYAEARDLSRRMLDARRRVLGKDHLRTMRALNNLAIAVHRLGDYPTASDLHCEELDLSSAALGPDHPGTLASMNNVARAQDALGRFTAARDLYQRTLDARRRILGPDHPDTLTSLNNLGNVMVRLRRYAPAQDLLRQALDGRRRVLGTDHPGTLQTMNNLANVAHGLGDHATARDAHRQTLDIRRRVLGPDHPDTLTSMNNLAVALHGLGSYAEARNLHQHVLPARDRILGPDHPQTSTSKRNLAAALDRLGDHTTATLLRDQALDARRRVLGPDHPHTLATLAPLQDTADPTPNNTEDNK